MSPSCHVFPGSPTIPLSRAVVIMLRRSQITSCHLPAMYFQVHQPSHCHALISSPIIPPSCTSRSTNHPTVMNLSVHQSSHRHALPGPLIIPPSWTYQFTNHPAAMHLQVHQSSLRHGPPGSPIIPPSCTIRSEKVKVSLS